MAKSSDSADSRRSVLITGGGGYIGRLVTERLAEEPGEFETIVCTDISLPTQDERADGVEYAMLDIRDRDIIEELLRTHEVDTVVHLATVVGAHEEAYAIDVGGTQNLLEVCVETGVQKIIVTSSGAAYGYHKDNEGVLSEDSPLRGNADFAYSLHKRLVEEMLEEYREEHPELEQLILRPGTILGESVQSPISDFFERPVIMGLRSAETPWVFIWDEDVVRVVVAGVHGSHTGVYNLAGDGVMTLREVAKAMDKRFIGLPRRLTARVLEALHRRGFVENGKEQVLFLAHRPVLSNEKLKSDFPYTPQKTTRQTFDHYWSARRG